MPFLKAELCVVLHVNKSNSVTHVCIHSGNPAPKELSPPHAKNVALC